ncbi:unnamed protein product [Ilex paraguariensis]|uniref:Uncharacterized protein n=1 Tax=Ilex paraguariensis TaxID=185542 RepID=A0ABC8UWJ6_9AQUA
MATTIIEPTRPIAIAITNPNPRQQVCFSFTAYTKNLIDHLKNFDIFTEQGLDDAELLTIESTFHFFLLALASPIGDPLRPNNLKSSQTYRFWVYAKKS